MIRRRPKWAVRYKVLSVIYSDDGRGQVYSPLPRFLLPTIIGTSWDMAFEKYSREFMSSSGTLRGTMLCAGIPVWRTRSDARSHLRELLKYKCYEDLCLVVAKVAVSGLLYEGKIMVNGRQYTGEAWKRIKVLEVVDSKVSVRMADKVN